jgi:tetratricopeptide (TPR) repeat protein
MNILSRTLIYALACALYLLIPQASPACMNGFSDVFDAYQKKSAGEYPFPLGHRVNPKDDQLLHYVDDWRRALNEGNFQRACNFGLYLVYAGKLDSAETHFRIVEEKWPNQYESAANLGTILEVNGKPEEALKWIKRSLELNPTAHQGSEWIHVKILETKLGLQLATDMNQTFGLDFGTETMPKMLGDKRQLKNLQKELFYQLNERVSFVQPKETLVASLLFELGNLSLQLGNYRAAFKTYKLAKIYGCISPLLKPRMKYTKRKF